MTKIPVYFMPGMAASSQIFEYIRLPEEQFEMYFLEWILPNKEESINSYAKRIAENIRHSNPVLVGVSFGGVLVQEIASLIPVQKTIIISSVKSNREFPRRMKLAKSTKLYKILPTGWANNVENLAKFSFGKTVTKRLELYEKYLSVRDKVYLDWALETIILWNRSVPDEKVMHIHGDSDEVFPIKYIKDCCVVKGGTHIMILNKFRWFNENLPKIILESETEK